MNPALIEMSPGNGGALASFNAGPYQASQSMAIAESSRLSSQIKAQLTVARGDRRDELECIERIKNSCQRIRLAEQAEYVYSRGGTNIQGASIRLIEVCAMHWGNIDQGWRELSRGNGESTIEAFAWDLQTNARRSVTFIIPHQMMVNKRLKYLTDPTDVFLWVANQAQRRVRSCIENVIPRDVIEEAIDECRATLKAEVDTNPEAIKRLVAAFEGLGVSKEQLEHRIQRRIDAIQPAQFINMRRIFTSIQDGMTDRDDWFKPVDEAEDSEKPKSTEEKIRGNRVAAKPTSEPVKDPEPKQEAKPDPKPEPPAKKPAKKPAAKPAAKPAEAKQGDLLTDDDAASRRDEIIDGYGAEIDAIDDKTDLGQLITMIDRDDRLSDADKKPLRDEATAKFNSMK